MSELNVTNIKHESSSSNNLVLGSDGNVSITNTLSAGTIGDNVVFPSGYMVFIKSQNRTGTGSGHDPGASFYPTTTSDLATKSFYLTITSSEHGPFSKIKIDFNASARIQEATHNFADFRLVRWTGTGNVSSETQIIYNSVGTAIDSPTENYVPMVGSAIDDISSIGSVQINYTLQYRNAGGNASYAGEIYFGHSTDVQMQIHAIGII